MGFGGPGWMGQYMGGLLSGVNEQAQRRENDWRSQRDLLERAQFEDTLKRQAENEARAREEARLNKVLTEQEMKVAADRYGLTQGLEGPDAEEFKNLQAMQPALMAQAEFQPSAFPAGAAPDFGTKAEAGMERQKEAKVKLGKLKMLQEKEAKAKKPLTRRELETIMKMDEADKRSGLTFEQRKALEELKITGRKDVAGAQIASRERMQGRQLRQVKDQFDEMMDFRYDSMRTETDRLLATHGDDSAVRAMDDALDNIAAIDTRIAQTMSSDAYAYNVGTATEQAHAFVKSLTADRVAETERVKRLRDGLEKRGLSGQSTGGVTVRERRRQPVSAPAAEPAQAPARGAPPAPAPPKAPTPPKSSSASSARKKALADALKAKASGGR